MHFRIVVLAAAVAAVLAAQTAATPPVPPVPAAPVPVAEPAPAAASADIRVVEEIVAKVNGEIITRGEIEKQRQLFEIEMRQQGGMTGPKLAEAVAERQKDALRDQIDQMLLVKRGKDLNVNIDPDVTRRLAEIQSQSKIADPDKFHEYIREQTGMTYEDFKQQMKNQILTQRVIGQEIGSRIAIPEADKRKYYDEHKSEFVRQEMIFMRQILLATEGKTPEQVAVLEKKAKDLVGRARKGEKFGELARDNSDDLETSKNFGELPPFKRGDLRKEIEEVVFKQKRGFVTDPIRVPNGLLILRIEERYETGQAGYEEVAEEINGRLAEPKMQPKVREYLTRLRGDAFLEIKPGYADSGAAEGKDTTWRDPAQLKPETTTKQEVASRRKTKRLLHIFPVPGTGSKPSLSVPPPTTTPVPAAPAVGPA